MRRQTKRIGIFLALVAMVLFALPVCCWLYFRSANAALVRRTGSLVDQNPQLQSAWDQALLDEVLTAAEAKAIEDAANEKQAPE